MPQRTDYILRMIEQLGAALIALRKRITGKQANREEVDKELRSVAGMAGFDLDIVRAATPEMLVMMASSGGALDNGKCWIMAEALFVDALDRHARDEPADFDRALRLYSLIDWPEAAERISEIAKLAI